MLTGKYTRGGDNDSLRKTSNIEWGRCGDDALSIARAVEQIADEYGVTSTQVATAWIMSQEYSMIPLVGARKVSQISDTLAAADLELGEEVIGQLNDLCAPKLGFPHDFLASDMGQNLIKGEDARHKVEHRPTRYDRRSR